ncbi:MAG: PH domain-containing protein [Nitrospirae bacterium]|nr:PH domain-containing protein [Fimbriimonadaceae bacterium]
METRYPTKVDLWLFLLVGVGMLVGTVAVIAAGFETGEWVAAGVFVLVWVLVGALAWPVEYVLSDEELVVRSGVIRWRVPLGEFVSISATRDPSSAPAWSLDRLKISYGTKFIMISPDRREEFLDDLEQRVRDARRMASR